MKRQQEFWKLATKSTAGDCDLLLRLLRSTEAEGKAKGWQSQGKLRRAPPLNSIGCIIGTKASEKSTQCARREQ